MKTYLDPMLIFDYNKQNENVYLYTFPHSKFYVLAKHHISEMIHKELT